ncbi:hypothetical protein F2Q69_00063591 [Brassica cretica]|uniref:Indole-3-acetic acid-amido synthetase GH3.17-like n=1 Tax=Brassica cretica TaxID=69181 RepID=A0A8S9RFC9_BRACR|nr:hypothetical protein F2Q69_00063591 [Brassica cretica]
MIFKFIQPISTTPCGLPLAPSITIIMKSKYYRSPGKRSTTPDEIIMCTDPKQSMYCQLLCGLVQRDEVVSVGALFASVLVQVIRFLEKYWKELCSNIRSGHVSNWITDLSCRDSVSTILGEPNPELADLIENECGQESWQGILSRLWPKTKCVETIVTGIMAQNIPALEFYSYKLPFVDFPSSRHNTKINMSQGCDLSVLEELTSNAKQIQDDVLTKILKSNANTEYLSRFLEGSSDKELFKKNVPVVSYEDVKPYIDRIANGESSDILSGEPITAFILSSGTSSGNQKMFPRNNNFENIKIAAALSSLVMSK